LDLKNILYIFLWSGTVDFKNILYIFLWSNTLDFKIILYIFLWSNTLDFKNIRFQLHHKIFFVSYNLYQNFSL
jgi:hypothetical protein